VADAAHGHVHLRLGDAVEEVLDHLELDLVAAAAGVVEAGQQVQVVADGSARRVAQQQVVLALGDPEGKAAAVLRQDVDGLWQLRQDAEGQSEELFPSGF